MSQNASRSGVDYVLMTFFGLLAAVGCFCSMFGGAMTLTDPGEGDLAMTLLFFGVALAGFGSVAMLAMRPRYRMGWPVLLIAVVVWSMGAIMFSIGVMTALVVDEPGNFMSNLGFSLGLCIGPGALLAVIGLLLFGYEAWRGMKNGDDEPTPEESATDWLNSVKADEKSKLDDDVF